MKKGISLIVLVITIIVMVIIASTVIISLNNGSIIQNAHDAVKLTNKQQLHDMASAAWAAAYVKGARTQEELQTAVDKALENIDTSKFKITVTTTGVTVQNKGNVELSLDKTAIEETISIGIPETVTLVATTKNIDKALTWTSSNEAVATVTATGNTATVTLLDGGVTTITASAEGVTATCTVNVKAEPLEGQQLTFAHNAFYGLHSVEVKGLSSLINGKTYIVVWDGVEYTCTARDRYFASTNTSLFGGATMYSAVGNSKIQKTIWGVAVTTTDADTGEPFLISYSNGTTYITSNDTKETHYVEIYEKVD